MIHWISFFLIVIVGGCVDSPETSAETTVIRSYDECFPTIVDNFSLQYDDLSTVHLQDSCFGTVQQGSFPVDHVVFLGDSITVGTFPTTEEQFYRSRVTHALVDMYDLALPEQDWFWVDYNTGHTKIQRSGDFSSCAKLGATASDLLNDWQQIDICITSDLWGQDILIVMTMGGNDLNDITQLVARGAPETEVWARAQRLVTEMDKALTYLATDAKFQGKIHLVFSNVYEFTDGTGNAGNCPLADMVNLDLDIEDPLLENVLLWIEKEYLAISRATGFDMLFLLENFCGHGFSYDDANGRCYRGIDAELWFDHTCFHPNPTGHEQLANMFVSVIAQAKNQ